MWPLDFDAPLDARAPGKEPPATAGRTATPAPFTLDLVLPNGTYTLILPDGSHRTFRVHRKPDWAKFAPGQRTIGLLIGPANGHDYEDFGFVVSGTVRVWKAHRGKPQERWARVLELWAAKALSPDDGYEVRLAKTCGWCNRLLTTPESIDIGLGPSCFSRVIVGGAA